ncbi:hypothetical protein [Amycolatopsis sp. MJM2582]|uniref:hypothetical protein n=1 Tax=Amycolatopsis sp. MJM2582 TaxID=1427749 RepID=UPI00126A3B68|nr:hypothetical protein [Amycolatopsis sp. MJM2582]
MKESSNGSHDSSTLNETANEDLVTVVDTNKRYFVARMATLMLEIPESDERSPASRLRSLKSALEKDVRVIKVLPHKFRPEWSGKYHFHKNSKIVTSEDLFNNDRMNIFQFNEPLEFQIRVPFKNQPAFKDSRKFPSEEYHVVWDGITALTIWESHSEARRSQAGGHAAIEVIEHAVTRAKLSSHIQSCSPGCSFQFWHRDLSILALENTEHSLEFKDTSIHTPYIGVKVEGRTEIHDVAASLFSTFDQDSLDFAISKNCAQRIRELENTTRSGLGKLLELNFTQAIRKRKAWHKRPREAWKYRFERGMQREYLTGTWLALSQLELLIREWQESTKRLDRRSEARHTAGMFTRDLQDDATVVESLNLDLLRSSLENLGDRFDSRVIAIATSASAAAAVIGGVIGGAL